MKLAQRIRNILLATTLLLGVSICAVAYVEACPFCAAVGLTFTDQMASKDVVVSARLLEIPMPDEDAEELPRAKFEIEKVFRGKELVKTGMKFEALLVGRYPPGQKFFVMGVNPPKINWTTPMKASDRVLEYLGKLDELPEKGADRLAFFQDYFEDEESLLAFDAYDEFAKAPYEDLIALKDRMDRERIIALINNDKTSPNRRRLYLTMLGVCGKAEDADMLEELLLSGSRTKMRGLEALIACYLNLKGEAGMEVVQREFFEKEDCEFTYTMLAMQALRFHAEETDVIPKERIVAAARKVLDNTEARDLVIPDLARWEDWTVMDRLVKIFKESTEDDSWIRVPIATYLMACPLPEAKVHLAELEQMDGASIERAKFLGGIDFDDFDDEDEEETENKTESQPAEKVDSDTSQWVPVDSRTASARPTQFVSLPSPLLAADPLPSDEPAKVTRHTVRRVEQPAAGANADSPSQSSGETLANSSEQTFVSNKSNQSMRTQSQVASQAPVVSPIKPVVAASPNLTWQIILVPMGVSVVLFVLLWSVLSGWFERLIF
jgi:hypothetical protein